MAISDEERVDTVVAVAEYLLKHRSDGEKFGRALFTFIAMDEQVKHAFESTDGFRRFVRDVLEKKGMLVLLAGGGHRSPLVFGVDNWELVERLQEPEEASKFLFNQPLPNVPESLEVAAPVAGAEEKVGPAASDDDVLAQYFSDLLTVVKSIGEKVSSIEDRLIWVELHVETVPKIVEQRWALDEVHARAHEHQLDARNKELVTEVQMASRAALDAAAVILPKIVESSERVEKAATAAIKLTDGLEGRFAAWAARLEKLEDKAAKFYDRLRAAQDKHAEAVLKNAATYEALSKVLVKHIDPIIEAGVSAAKFMEQIDYVLVGKARFARARLSGMRADILATPDAEDAVAARYTLPDEQRKKANGGAG
jgi:hypothetical protein